MDDLVATLPGARLEVAASYGKKRVLQTLAFSSGSRILLITINGASRSVKLQKNILRDRILCNSSLGKHGFFVARLAAALHLDLGLYIWNAFDIASSGDSRGSVAAYKAVLTQARPGNPLSQSAVKSTSAEKRFIPSREPQFALRAWACYVVVQGVPDKPGAIDTLVKDSQARPTHQPCIGFP